MFKTIFNIHLKAVGLAILTLLALGLITETLNVLRAGGFIH